MWWDAVDLLWIKISGEPLWTQRGKYGFHGRCGSETLLLAIKLQGPPRRPSDGYHADKGGQSVKVTVHFNAISSVKLCDLHGFWVSHNAVVESSVLLGCDAGRHLSGLLNDNMEGIWKEASVPRCRYRHSSNIAIFKCANSDMQKKKEKTLNNNIFQTYVEFPFAGAKLR
jgi:hypothetical protein